MTSLQSVMRCASAVPRKQQRNSRLKRAQGEALTLYSSRSSNTTQPLMSSCAASSAYSERKKREGEIRYYPAVILGISVRTSRKFRRHRRRHDDHEVQLAWRMMRPRDPTLWPWRS